MKRGAQIVVGTGLLFLGAVGLLAWQAVRYPEEPASGARREIKLVVERGSGPHAGGVSSLHEIARRLYELKIIEHPSWFRFYANERGLAQKIREGQYTLSVSTMTLTEILLTVWSKESRSRRWAVTLPEGKNLAQVASYSMPRG